LVTDILRVSLLTAAVLSVCWGLGWLAVYCIGEVRH